MRIPVDFVYVCYSHTKRNQMPSSQSTQKKTNIDTFINFQLLMDTQNGSIQKILDNLT